MTPNTVGKDTELRVVKYLREWWPSAERKVRTGYRVRTRTSEDTGDILGTPGITWQVKSLRRRDESSADPCTAYELKVPEWLAQTEAQRIADGGSLGFLVVRRWGTTDVGRWWAFQRVGQLYGLLVGDPDHQPVSGELVPCRMDMAALVGILDQVGWTGQSAEEGVG